MHLPRTRFSLIVVLLTAVFGLSACEEAPAGTRAGVWKGTTECGDFTLFVSEGGTTITNANWEIRKPDLGKDPLRLSKYTDSKPWDTPFAFQGRDLSMHFNAGQFVTIALDATFSRSGKELSGKAHFLPSEDNGGCKARFSISR